MIDAYLASGLSAPRFASLHGVNYQTLVSWIKKANGHCTYDCYQIDQAYSSRPYEDSVIFDFKICGEDKERVDRQNHANLLSSFCPDVIEFNVTLYPNGTFSTNDIPPGSPPTSLLPKTPLLP